MINQNLDLEKILVKKSIEGCSKSFQTLIENQKSKLNSLKAMVSDFSQEEYEDCLQNASLKAFLNLKDFHHKCSFTTWFYVILKNEIIQFSKKKNLLNNKEISINAITENDDNFDNLFGKLEENAQTIISKQEQLNEYKEILQKCLDKLEPRYKEVLNLAFLEGKTRKEMSDILQIPLGSVLSRIYVARQKAQKVILSHIKMNNISLDCVKL